MANAFARPIQRVDEQLTTLAELQRDTASQLDYLRRQMAELVTAERSLFGALASRQRRIDSLLDERLLAVAAEEIVSA
jgi:hypothetical protein